MRYNVINELEYGIICFIVIHFTGIIIESIVFWMEVEYGNQSCRF